MFDELMKLNELRIEMYEIFIRISKTPEHDTHIEKYLELMDEHQRILSGVARSQNIGD